MVQRIFPCMCFSGGSTAGVCKGQEFFFRDEAPAHLDLMTKFVWLH